MLDQNITLVLILIPLIPGACFIFYFLARTAVNAAIREYQGSKTINRWFLAVIVIILLATYVLLKRPFRAIAEPDYHESPQVFVAITLGVLYLAIELPYQLIKMASKDIAEEILSSGDDRRNVARMKSAQTLATIVSRKLKVSCELQSFTSNQEFVFLTYVLDNKPIANRLKLNQADKAESWKKLGEWMITNYQKENP